MNRIVASAVAMLAVAACTAARTRQPVTPERFETIKRICDVEDAYILDVDGRRGVTFKGAETDFAGRQMQARCLKTQFKGTDIQFIGFLSEPPR